MTNIKSIAIIAGSYPSPGRPELVFVEQLVNAWADLGINVVVIAPQSITNSVVHRRGLLPKKSQHVTANGNSYFVYRPFAISFGNHLKSLKWLVRDLTELGIRKILRKHQVDVIYTHFWSSTLNIYRYASMKKIPLFVACGEGDNALEEMVETMPSKSFKHLVSTVTAVVSVSTENKRKCIKYSLAQQSHIGVFPNCVNTDIFKPKDVSSFKSSLGISKDDFVIVFVGGFIPRKGPDRLAEALTQINDDSIKVLFIGKPFAGYNYDFDCKGIIHKGSIDHDLLPDYLNCADIFVLPTLKEGCSNAIVEALATCVPVISSDAPFNEDILNDQNSIKIDPMNVSQIKDAILKLKTDNNLRESMKKKMLESRELYSINDRAKRILNFMNSQLN